MSKKIVICGVHGTGKSKICERIKFKLCDDFFNKEKLKINKDSTYGPTEIQLGFQNKFAYIPEQFREVVKDIPNFTKQTQEITFTTYAKQLYLENLYTVQGKNILCDRSVLDTFVYCDYFDWVENNDDDCWARECSFSKVNNSRYSGGGTTYQSIACAARNYVYDYSKIYLIEPSDRLIEADGFRLTDKTQQLEIHNIFLEYFTNSRNVVIINQEEQDKIVEMVVNDFNI